MDRSFDIGGHRGTSSLRLALALFFVGCGDSDSPAAEQSQTNGATAQTGAGDAGSSGDAGSAPGECVAGDMKPCTSFTTPTGTKLPLGPYGAVMEANVGKGFENAVQSGDTNPTTCKAFSAIFGEDPKLTDQLLETNVNGLTLDFALYTVYRPASWKAGETYPVITWGNGTCAQPEGYGALLRFVASAGYVVIAANSRWVGMGTPAPMLRALDFAAAANADPTSPYYQKLDLTKVGAMGHSQGGGATVTAAADPRISSVIIFNAGGTAVPKPYLLSTGDADIAGFTPESIAADIAASTVPAAYLYYHNPAGMGAIKGHLVLMMTPDRVTGSTLAWWDMTLRKDAASRAWFDGPSCKLCSQAADFEFGQHML
jgi:pimeloyl-ACP methyl ester carboxylesterase